MLTMHSEQKIRTTQRLWNELLQVKQHHAKPTYIFKKGKPPPLHQQLLKHKGTISLCLPQHMVTPHYHQKASSKSTTSSQLKAKALVPKQKGFLPPSASWSQPAE